MTGKTIIYSGGDKGCHDVMNSAADEWWNGTPLQTGSSVSDEFLVIGSRQQLLKINHSSVRVGMIDIKPVKLVRNLGAWFNSHFSMPTHTSKSCSAAFFWLHNIKRISHFLPRDKLEMVLHAFVTSKIDYCNGLLYGLPDCEIAKLQRVQNAAARLLMSCKKYYHITPILIKFTLVTSKI